MTQSLFGEVLSQQVNPSLRRPLGNKALPAGRAKQLGLLLAMANHKEALQVAQLLAQFLGRKQETVCADDVFALMDPKALGPAAGAIFSGPEWQAVGIRQSTRAGRRAGLQRTWRLKNLA